MMLFYIFIIINLLLTAADQSLGVEHCDKDTETCAAFGDLTDRKLIFFDVNPPEGFNLRRDVYMRFAIMLAEEQKSYKKLRWTLVLPPWHRLYHWRSHRNNPLPWNAFFDIKSLKSFAPVAELHEVFSQTPQKILQIDRMYVLLNYLDPFEGGTFQEKWEITDEDCDYDGQFWGFRNITVGEVICVRYQGKISMISELLAQHPSDKMVMFAHGEIPLHDSYGSKMYWDCRKSMTFSKTLIERAKEFIRKHLNCKAKQCSTYVSVHWRRQDFAQNRRDDVPSIKGTSNQIDFFIKRNTPNIRKVFVATDAPMAELEILENELKALEYKVYSYLPTVSELDEFNDGGVAIVDQIICSHATFFIGTHESTFSYRIQEEREILGFKSNTTFNRLCPDKGQCDKPSRWTIVQ